MAEARPVRQKPSDTNGQQRGTRSACDRGGTCELLDRVKNRDLTSANFVINITSSS
ncbi:hypothetical protein BgiMline_011513, partial [Biomphalaria glabrata]